MIVEQYILLIVFSASVDGRTDQREVLRFDTIKFKAIILAFNSILSQYWLSKSYVLSKPSTESSLCLRT
jgi:hypothetical protein